MNESVFVIWRRNFLAGLAVVAPAVISIALVVWLFGTISNFTDTLLIFLPRTWTHDGDAGSGPMYWYWRAIAFIVAFLLIVLVGVLTRNYLGKRLIRAADETMLKVPIINKIYGATKQVNEAFSSGSKNSFQRVVLIEFPRPGAYAIGFVTSDADKEIQRHTGPDTVSVFVPTTPNPTGGFLIMLPASQLINLDMSVADGIKFIVSLGSISPDNLPPIAS